MTPQDTEAQTYHHTQTQKLTTAITILNRRVEMSHHIHDLTINKINQTITLIKHIQITPDHNHLYLIELEIVQDYPFLVIDSAM